MGDEALLYIIYLESRMLLSKKCYSGWRQIQDEFADYKASLGPWPVVEVLEFLCTEYPSHCPFNRQQIDRFLLSDEETIAAEPNAPANSDSAL
jgi:hypothetical protein